MATEHSDVNVPATAKTANPGFGDVQRHLADIQLEYGRRVDEGRRVFEKESADAYAAYARSIGALTADVQQRATEAWRGYVAALGEAYGPSEAYTRCVDALTELARQYNELVHPAAPATKVDEAHRTFIAEYAAAVGQPDAPQRAADSYRSYVAALQDAWKPVERLTALSAAQQHYLRSLRDAQDHAQQRAEQAYRELLSRLGSVASQREDAQRSETAQQEYVRAIQAAWSGLQQRVAEASMQALRAAGEAWGAGKNEVGSPP